MKLQEKELYIVAELSANHRQDKSVALESIRAAAGCGVDAIKVQTYTPDTLTIDCDNEYFQIRQGTIWDEQDPIQPLPGGVHALGMAPGAQTLRRRKRAGFLLLAVRPDGGGPALTARRRRIQDRFLRDQ